MKLKTLQLQNIERGFNEVILRLQNKRDQLKAEFTARYDEENSRFFAKVEQIDNNARDIDSIGVIY